MNTKAMKAQLEADTNKLLATMAKARAASEGIQAETKEAVEIVEKRIEETTARLHQLRLELQPYVDGKKDLDKEFATKARTYENLTHQKMTLIRAYHVAQASLDEAKLGSVGMRQNYPEPEGVSQ